MSCSPSRVRGCPQHRERLRRLVAATERAGFRYRPATLPGSCVFTQFAVVEAAPNRLPTEATVPLGVRPQGPEEVDSPEVGPVRLAEVELAVGALPQQEPR